MEFRLTELFGWRGLGCFRVHYCISCQDTGFNHKELVDHPSVLVKARAEQGKAWSALTQTKY